MFWVTTVTNNPRLKMLEIADHGMKHRCSGSISCLVEASLAVGLRLEDDEAGRP